MTNFWLNRNQSKEIKVGSLVRCKKTGTLMNVCIVDKMSYRTSLNPVSYNNYICQWFDERKLCIQMFTKGQIELERTS